MESLGITVEQFEHWSLIIGLTLFVLYLLYIIYRLAKDSKAGKLGYFILFFALGLGIFAFIAKEFLIRIIQ